MRMKHCHFRTGVKKKEKSQKKKEDLLHTALAVGSWGSSTAEEYVEPDSDASCDVLSSFLVP